MNKRTLEKHLKELSCAYPLDVDEKFQFFILRDFNLPPGYNFSEIDIWTTIPPDYPESPPGVGDAKIYVPDNLEYQGQAPKDFHPETGPEGWAWWCYEWIKWDPCYDDLIAFFEIVRAHMTKPD